MLDRSVAAEARNSGAATRYDIATSRQVVDISTKRMNLKGVQIGTRRFRPDSSRFSPNVHPSSWRYGSAADRRSAATLWSECWLAPHPRRPVQQTAPLTERLARGCGDAVEIYVLRAAGVDDRINVSRHQDKNRSDPRMSRCYRLPPTCIDGSGPPPAEGSRTG